MSSETKICQSCKQPFTIEPADFAFYEKMHVPLPRRCPFCRINDKLNIGKKPPSKHWKFFGQFSNLNLNHITVAHYIVSADGF